VHFETAQLILGLLAALVTGFSKAGVPGTGILVVPLMAAAFGGHMAVGATVPLLLVGDCIAVYLYKGHCDWGRLRQISPAVIVGLLLGVVFLRFLPTRSNSVDPLNVIIGLFILVMLAFQLLRDKLKDRLVPTSPIGTAVTGLAAGFSTMVSNAAGPIMSIYLTATKMPKNSFMGTAACYFLIFNSAKLPFLLWLSARDPAHPFLNLSILRMDAVLVPGVLVGAGLGRWVLPILPEKVFVNVVLVLAALAAVKLLLG
jgi:uncharacterized protein